MAFSAGLIFTNAGKLAQQRAQFGEELKITRLGMGDGSYSGSIGELTRLVREVFTVDTSVKRIMPKGEAYIGGVFSNASLSQGFYWREYGVFAIDPVTKQEILYAYGNAGDSAEWIPPGSSMNLIVRKLGVNILIGNATNIQVTRDESLMYVTFEEFDELVAQVDAKEGLIRNAAVKTTLADADTMPLTDSADAGKTKKITWVNIKAVLKTWLDTLYSAVGHTHTKSQVGLGNVDNTSDLSKPVSTATSTELNKKEAAANKGVAGGYASLDGNAKVPLSQINDALLGNVSFQGTWNAQTNTPALPATPATKGHYYIVSTAGTQFGISFEVGDWLLAESGKWSKVDNTDAVASVAGRTGVIVLTKTDVGLGNVDNTSDANKPVSTATQTALNGKAGTAAATQAANGLMSAADKMKLDLTTTEWIEDAASTATVRTVQISGITDWDDILHVPLFIKTAVAGTTSSTFTINSLTAKSLYFPSFTGTGLSTSTGGYNWVRANDTYLVIWDGSYLKVLDPKTRYADSSYWGYVRAINGASGSFVRSLLAVGAVTDFNVATYLSNQDKGVSFTNTATGAPAGLPAGTYYGYLKVESAYSTTSYNVSYGVYQTLSVPSLRKTYHRWVYVGATTDYPPWEEIASGDGVPVAIATGGTTAYVAVPSSPWASYTNTKRITIIMPSTNAASPTLNVSGLGAINMKDKSGANLAASKLKSGMPYEFMYYNSAFILLGEGGGGTATAADILSGKTATVDSGLITGAMANRGAPTWTPSASAQSLSAGYYSGGTVAAIPSTFKRYASTSFTYNFSTDGSSPIKTVTLGWQPSKVFVEAFIYGSTGVASINGSQIAVIASNTLGSTREFVFNSTGFSIEFRSSLPDGTYRCHAIS